MCLQISSFHKIGQEWRVLYMKTHILVHILSYLARLFLGFSQPCERAQELLKQPFQRCDTSRGVSFTQWSSIRQTSTAVNDVIRFNKAYGHWQSPLRVFTASSADNVSQLTVKCSKDRISLGPGIPRPLKYHYGDNEIMRCQKTKDNKTDNVRRGWQWSRGLALRNKKSGRV